MAPTSRATLGLKPGSQAPPGVYVAVPLWFYTADAVKGRDGDELLTGNLDAAVFGVALNVVTTDEDRLAATTGSSSSCPGRTIACRAPKTSTPIPARA